MIADSFNVVGRCFYFGVAWVASLVLSSPLSLSLSLYLFLLDDDDDDGLSWSAARADDVEEEEDRRRRRSMRRRRTSRRTKTITVPNFFLVAPVLIASSFCHVGTIGMMIDSGAQVCCLPLSIADQLKLHIVTTKTKMRTASGSDILYKGRSSIDLSRHSSYSTCGGCAAADSFSRKASRTRMDDDTRRRH